MGELTIKDFQGFVLESAETHSVWHKESWEDCAFRDGAHWTVKDKKAMLNKGINPITANRVFPVVNLLTGYQANNPLDVTAKGRTPKDSETGQVMSDAIKYVFDACSGIAKIREAYEDQIIPGYGYLKVDTLDDPRREPVFVAKYPWYTFGWDRFGDPWLDPLFCRYCFYYDWKDVSDVVAAWPDKEQEIMSEFRRMAGSSGTTTGGINTTFSVSDEVESHVGQMAGGLWADKVRKRVKPVELYYTVDEEALFVEMPNGGIYELSESMDKRRQYQMICGCRSYRTATVKKIRRVNFLGDLILEDIPSPHNHDRYPFVPFISYLDRFRMPFGIPRQIKEQAMETNKRRSVGLALLHAKRMIVERGAVEDPNLAFSEMNKLLGLIEVEEGKLDNIKIEDLSDMAAAQVQMMQLAEQEIKEISGANDEALGYETRVMSGTALDKKQQQSGTMTATVAKNMERSTTMLGQLVGAEVQGEWDGPKVLRVTDRMTGADRFVEINQPIHNANGDVIEIKNNLREGLFDYVIAKKPLSDTQREQNVELLFNAIQKSPPEAIPELLNMAFEMSDFPQKEALLSRFRTVLGVEPIDTMLSKEEQEAKQAQRQAAIEEKSAEDAQYEKQQRELELQEREAKVEKQMAEIKKILVELKQKERAQASQDYKDGFRIMQETMKQRESGVPLESR